MPSLHPMRATCTRVFIDEEGNEGRTVRGFLWENVEDIEESLLPGCTDLHFVNGSVITALGNVRKWLRRWDAYLVAQQRWCFVLPSDN